MKIPAIDLGPHATTSLYAIGAAFLFLLWFFYPQFTAACESFSLLPACGYAIAVFVLAVTQATRAKHLWQLFVYWASTLLMGAAVLYLLLMIVGLPICSGP